MLPSQLSKQAFSLLTALAELFRVDEGGGGSTSSNPGAATAKAGRPSRVRASSRGGAASATYTAQVAAAVGRPRAAVRRQLAVLDALSAAAWARTVACARAALLAYLKVCLAVGIVCVAVLTTLCGSFVGGAAASAAFLAYGVPESAADSIPFSFDYSPDAQGRGATPEAYIPVSVFDAPGADSYAGGGSGWEDGGSMAAPRYDLTCLRKAAACNVSVELVIPETYHNLDVGVFSVAVDVLAAGDGGDGGGSCSGVEEEGEGNKASSSSSSSKQRGENGSAVVVARMRRSALLLSDRSSLTKQVAEVLSLPATLVAGRRAAPSQTLTLQMPALLRSDALRRATGNGGRGGVALRVRITPPVHVYSSSLLVAPHVGGYLPNLFLSHPVLFTLLSFAAAFAATFSALSGCWVCAMGLCVLAYARLGGGGDGSVGRDGYAADDDAAYVTEGGAAARAAARKSVASEKVGKSVGGWEEEAGGGEGGGMAASDDSGWETACDETPPTLSHPP